MSKSNTELIGDEITKFLYAEEKRGLAMEHFSELGWRIALKVKDLINERPELFIQPYDITQSIYCPVHGVQPLYNGWCAEHYTESA
jgi:hypothetical protein